MIEYKRKVENNWLTRDETIDYLLRELTKLKEKEIKE
jgi:hypothetical protein